MIAHLRDVLAVSPGWLAVACLGVAVLSYFLGCFNGAVVVSRYILRNDVRNHGSGNGGLTNFHRTFGGPLTGAVVAADVLKAVIAVLFSMWLFGVLSPELVTFSKYWAGMFCLLGHMFPCTFQFRGGKGILSGGAIAIMIDWRVALVVWGGFLVLAVLTRYVSLGSCWAGASFPFVTGFVYRDVVLVVMAVIIGGLILWKHRGNIQRLVSGTESKFTLHKKTEETKPEEETKPKEETES
jgi:glycerol-3-phosphate acyltransferase PlsY